MVIYFLETWRVQSRGPQNVSDGFCIQLPHTGIDIFGGSDSSRIQIVNKDRIPQLERQI
jgi:hypothetical protein